MAQERGGDVLSNVALTLGRDDEAPAIARRFVSESVGPTLPVHTLEDAHIVVSELVTNAVEHGVGVITVCLAVHGDVLIIEVTDEQVGRGPALRGPSRDDESGHGLQLVAALSTAWGWSLDTSHKVVWAGITI